MPSSQTSAHAGYGRIPGRTTEIVVRAVVSTALSVCLLAGSLRVPYVDHATVGLLLLAAVVGLGVYWGTLEALAAAIVGGAGFDYFYLPPLGFGIEKPEHWITLAIFLFVAASTGHLASRLKQLLDKRTSLMQLSLEPLCISDLKGNLESANGAFIRLVGWPEQELSSRPLIEFVHSADRPRTEAAIREAAHGGSAIEIENRFQSAEGDWRWLRWRIARELHDDFTQRLAALGIELGLLKQGGEAQDQIALDQDLTRLQTQVLSLSEDIRRLSHSLHPSVLEHSSLAAALEAYCREFSGRTGIAATFISRNVPAEIPRPVALAFYRIAQEALRNVALHSGATAVSVVLAGENLSLNVIDDGRGFDMAQAKKSPGLGLVSMEERARLVGAVVTVESVPGEGTTVSAEISPNGQVLQ